MKIKSPDLNQQQICFLSVKYSLFSALSSSLFPIALALYSSLQSYVLFGRLDLIDSDGFLLIFGGVGVLIGLFESTILRSLFYKENKNKGVAILISGILMLLIGFGALFRVKNFGSW